jgi:hypothetical protein
VGIVTHPNLPELYRKKVAKLQHALQHENNTRADCRHYPLAC